MHGSRFPACKFPQGTFLDPISWSVLCKHSFTWSQTQSPVSMRAELRLQLLCHGEFGLKLSLRTGWLSLTAEAEGHHVPLGTIAVPPCHFHFLIHRPQHMAHTSRLLRERVGKRREEGGEKKSWTLSRVWNSWQFPSWWGVCLTLNQVFRTDNKS